MKLHILWLQKWTDEICGKQDKLYISIVKYKYTNIMCGIWYRWICESINFLFCVPLWFEFGSLNVVHVHILHTHIRAHTNTFPYQFDKTVRLVMFTHFFPPDSSIKLCCLIWFRIWTEIKPLELWNYHRTISSIKCHQNIYFFVSVWQCGAVHIMEREIVCLFIFFKNITWK